MLLAAGLVLRGAAPALLTTRGFRDVREMRRVRVPRLYEPLYEKPPPLVPRAVDDFLPISADKNDCVGCHDKPGGKKAKGAPTPMPALHYAKTAEARPRLSGDYYNCTLCHAAAAGVKDLVVNKAPKPAR